MNHQLFDYDALTITAETITGSARMDAARLASGMAVKHSPTSVAADGSMSAAKANLRTEVFRWLERNGPATDEQMQAGLDLNPSTQRPRRIELVRVGRVVDTGRTAKTTSGRSAVLWEAV